MVILVTLVMMSADPRWAVDSWPRELGNHRALVQVSEPAGAVRVRLDWRRRDPRPGSKAVYVLAASTGARVANVLARTVNREFGEFVFEPTAGVGTYAIYFMPYRHTGPQHQFKTEYAVPDYSAAPQWLRKYQLLRLACSMNEADQREAAKTRATPCPARSLARQESKDGLVASDDVWQRIPAAEVVAFESRSEFDRRDPMEVIATEQETRRLVAANPEYTALLFPEDRRYPVRMTDDLPLRWIEAGPFQPFDGYISYRLTLTPNLDCSVSDLRLEIPLRPDVATYMMGMGRKGGYRPTPFPSKPGVVGCSDCDPHDGLHTCYRSGPIAFTGLARRPAGRVIR